MLGEQLAAALLPTRSGAIRIHVSKVDASEHVVLTHGEVPGASHVPTYVHEACLMGEVFGSLRCECRGRLDRALEWLGQASPGAIVYLRHAPRGAPDLELATALLRSVGIESGRFVNHEGATTASP